MTGSKAVELELAEYKFKTGTALTKVQKVSDTFRGSAENLPLPTWQREIIEQQLEESNNVLEKAETEIEREVQQLSNHE